MTARSNMKSTASVTSFPDTPRPLFGKRAKTERYGFVSFFTFRLFHNLWKTPWKTQKHLIFLHFLLLKNICFFNIAYFLFPSSKGKKKDFSPENLPFARFSERNFSFPKSFHIFLFSTGHLFKNFPKEKHPLGFTQNAKGFPTRFP